jgi:hypothetical protein
MRSRRPRKPRHDERMMVNVRWSTPVEWVGAVSIAAIGVYEDEVESVDVGAGAV